MTGNNLNGSDIQNNKMISINKYREICDQYRHGSIIQHYVTVRADEGSETPSKSLRNSQHYFPHNSKYKKQ